MNMIMNGLQVSPKFFNQLLTISVSGNAPHCEDSKLLAHEFQFKPSFLLFKVIGVIVSRCCVRRGNMRAARGI